MISIFNLTLAANEAREVAITGEYFELRNALYPVTLIELLDRSGGVISRLENPEQSDFVRPGRYETVRITNGPTAQTVKHFYGTGDAGSRRTSGLVKIDGTSSVSVVDGGKLLTMAGYSFMGQGSLAGAGGVNAHIQLFNPGASGKNLIVERITAVADTGAVYFGFNAAALATALGAAKSKLSGGAASVGLIYNQNVAAAISPLGGFTAPAAVSLVYPLVEPIIVKPGFGLVCWANSVTTGITALFEFIEEAV